MNTQASGLAALLPLFRELTNLERIRVAGKAGSWAERAFVRIRARLVAGEDPRDLALAGTTRAVAATLLAGIDADVLAIARNTMGQTPGGSLPLIDSRTGQTEEIVVPPEQGRSPIAVGIEEFSRCLRLGVPFPHPPAHDLHTMRLLAAANPPRFPPAWSLTSARIAASGSGISPRHRNAPCVWTSITPLQRRVGDSGPPSRLRRASRVPGGRMKAASSPSAATHRWVLAPPAT